MGTVTSLDVLENSEISFARWNSNSGPFSASPRPYTDIMVALKVCVAASVIML